MLKNKNILVGVTGSIAIYKTLELIRLYIKAGANVKVIMSSCAKKFITPLTFETISKSCILDDTNESWEKDSIYNHIAIGKWTEVFVVAPCSVNTINKLSSGICDNILTQALIAYKGTKLLAPSANTFMLENHITKQSFKNLSLANYKIISPISKELACGDIGQGAMCDVEDIYYATLRQLFTNDYWDNRKVILSGGGTREKIDDIRYISNFSSGKMATSLAIALYIKGAEVSLVTTKESKDLPSEVNIIYVNSSLQMYKALENEIKIVQSNIMKNTTQGSKNKIPYFFMVAAVSDYVPSDIKKGKLKKMLLGDTWNLELKQNLDILNTLDKNNLITIGFKAETNEEKSFSNASNMLKNKNLDAVCLNIINKHNTFGLNTNKISLISKEDTHLFDGAKFDISLDILDTLSCKFND